MTTTRANSTFTTHRYEQVGDKNYLVVNGVALVEGVLNGRFVPFDEFSFAHDWNGVPVVVRHPKKNMGSARVPNPDVLTVGRFYGAKASKDGRRLTGEFWLDDGILESDPDAASLREAVLKNQKIEVSTGYFSSDDLTPGQWKGTPYRSVDRNIHPDHIALLPDEIGACSVSAGCGLNRNQAKQNCSGCTHAAPQCFTENRSGNFWHKGRPGLVGGSSPEQGYALTEPHVGPSRDEDIRNEELRNAVKRARQEALSNDVAMVVYKQTASNSYHYIDEDTWLLSTMKEPNSGFEAFAKVYGNKGLEWVRKTRTAERDADALAKLVRVEKAIDTLGYGDKEPDVHDFIPDMGSYMADLERSYYDGGDNEVNGDAIVDMLGDFTDPKRLPPKPASMEQKLYNDALDEIFKRAVENYGYDVTRRNAKSAVHNVTGSLPASAKKVWEEIYQSALKEYDDEEKAARTAWSAIKKQGWHKKGGKWMKSNVVYLPRHLAAFVDSLLDTDVTVKIHGGKGSGNFGHSGRSGQVGGSDDTDADNATSQADSSVGSKDLSQVTRDEFIKKAKEYLEKTYEVSETNWTAYRSEKKNDIDGLAFELSGEDLNSKPPANWSRWMDEAFDEWTGGAAFDSDVVENGDLVDFGVYGKNYVVDRNYGEGMGSRNEWWWITDDKSERFNPKASGHSIQPTEAIAIIESASDIDPDDYTDEDVDDEE